MGNAAEILQDEHPLSHAELLGEIDEIMVDTALDTAAFAQMFMPHRFYRDFDPAYDEIFEILDNDDIPKAAIAAPRGTGKTSIDAIAFPARKICFRDCKFVVVVSATHGLAAQIVQQLGRELDENPFIRKIFGRLKGDKWAEGSGELRTSTGITILARGAGQQVRGLLQERRPDLIIIDDLEDSEPFRIGDPEEYVRKTWEWLKTDLLNIIDRYSKSTRIVYLGTILGENAILSRLLENKSWHSTRLELCDDNYTSNFPSLMSDEDVRALAREYEEEGDLDFFYREFRNLPIAGPSAIFTKDRFKYWEQADLSKGTYVEKVVIVDPAKTVKISSAFTAVVGIGFDAANKKIMQLDTVNKRMEPDEIYKTAHEMAVRLGTHVIACETTSLELFIEYPFNAYLRTKGFPAMLPIKAVGKKQERIRELAPLYRMGYIFHHPDQSIHGPLESQLLTFPRSKYWDVMDAFAYFLKLFDLHNRMFVMNEKEDSAAFDEEIKMLDEMDQGLDAFDYYEISP